MFLYLPPWSGLLGRFFPAAPHYRQKRSRSVTEDKRLRGQHKKVGMFLAKWVRSLGVADWANMPNHAWRHTYKTVCFEAEIEERAADYMQGYASKGQGRRYGTNTIPALATQLANFRRFEFA